MKFFSRWFEKRAVTTPFPLKGPEDARLHYADRVYRFGGGGETGIHIHEESALETTAGAACIDFLSNVFASLATSGKTYKDKEEIPNHPTTQIVKKPNEELYTSSVFWQMVITQLCTYGNHYSLIHNGTLTSIDPKKVTLKFDTAWHPYYEIDREKFSSYQIFHVPGLVVNGFVGLSPVLKNRRTFELAIASEMMAGQFFGKGNHSQGYYTTPDGLSDEAFDRLVEYRNKAKGMDTAGEDPIFENGIEWKPKGFSPEASQMLQQRQYSDRKICQIYRVRPYMIGIETSGKTAEQESLDFEKYCLRPWITRVEQEVERKLISEEEKSAGIYYKMNVDSLLRADITTRYTAHNSALQNGWKNRNEIRALEDLPPIEGGDDYIMPLNMGTVGGETPQPINADPEPEAKEPEAEVKEPNTKQMVRDLTPILEDATRRILTKETKTLQNAIKKNFKDTNNPDGFRIFVDEFYIKHEATIRQTLEPVAKVLEIELDKLVADHINGSRRSLEEAGDNPEAIENTLKDWMETRC